MNPTTKTPLAKRKTQAIVGFVRLEKGIEPAVKTWVRTQKKGPASSET
jgi:hypothetical protein